MTALRATMSTPTAAPALSIVIPTINEARNLEFLLPLLNSVLQTAAIGAEILVVDGGSDDDTREVAEALGTQVVIQKESGYGAALLAGFAIARADFIVTMDADLSHPATVIKDLWAARDLADVIVASRYVPGGDSKTSRFRRTLSRILNAVYRRLLSLPTRDLSSGFRLYRRPVLQALTVDGHDFDVLPEILTRAYTEGYRIAEIPFVFASRGAGCSHVRLLRFGWAYLVTLLRLWRLRNSIQSAG